MSQSEAVERIIARHREDAAVAVIVAWAKTEQDRLAGDYRPAWMMKTCAVCGQPSTYRTGMLEPTWCDDHGPHAGQPEGEDG